MICGVCMMYNHARDLYVCGSESYFKYCEMLSCELRCTLEQIIQVCQCVVVLVKTLPYAIVYKIY